MFLKLFVICQTRWSFLICFPNDGVWVKQLVWSSLLPGFFFKSFWQRWLVFALILQSHQLPNNLWRLSATSLSMRSHIFMHLSSEVKHKKGARYFFSACLVPRLLNSHYIPFPAVQNHIFLKLSSLNLALLTALYCLSLFLLESKLVKLASSSQ